MESERRMALLYYQIVSVRTLAALAWISLFTLMWCILFGIVRNDWIGALGFIFFFSVAIFASGIESKNDE